MEFQPLQENLKTEYAWVTELIRAEAEDDLETWHQFVNEDEEDAMISACVRMNKWGDDALQEKVIDTFGDELRYVETEADLAEAESVENQFALLRQLTIDQRAGLFELKGRQVLERLEQGA